MPGRLALYSDTEFKQQIIDIFPTFSDEVITLTPSYNIAPTHQIPVLLNNGVYTYAQFGFIPSFSKDKKSIQINARSESVHEKVSFQNAFVYQRCLVPINGFYEWKDLDGQKVPYYIKPSSFENFALAGLYNTWYDAFTGESCLSVALITSQPNEVIEPIHDRMPVILEKNEYQQWLKGEDLNEMKALLKPCKESIIVHHEVSEFVNSVQNNTLECVTPYEATRYVQGSLF